MFANILAQLGINSTIWVQLAVFISLYLLLRFIYFNPFLRLIEERESKTEGMKEESARMNAEADKKEQKLSEKINATKVAARNEHDSALNKAKKESSVELEKARAINKEKLETARKEIQSDSDNTINELKEEVNSLASVFVEKLTDAKVKL